MSAHHSFRDFACCDSDMILWSLVAEPTSTQGKSLSQLVGERIDTYACSSEINYRINDAKAVIQVMLDHYAVQSPKLDTTDGISLAFADWRMNLRLSNTEPLLRLNIEARGGYALVDVTLRTIRVLINHAQ